MPKIVLNDLPGRLGLLQVRRPLVFGHVDQFVLQNAGEGNQRRARVVFVDPLLDLDQPAIVQCECTK